MAEEFQCFNCGRPTTVVDEGHGPICADCLAARGGEVAPEVEGQDYHQLTVDELRDILRDRDLSVSGTKAELVERLNDDDAGDEG